MTNLALHPKSLIPYLTFGDPSISAMKDQVLNAVASGADVIELGMPFSDPIADGPVIQAAHQRALQACSALSFLDLFAFVQSIKPIAKVPFVGMSDVNLLHQFGLKKWFQNARKAGLDGIILPNVPIEEMGLYQPLAKQYGVPLIPLVSPLCPLHRLYQIVESVTAFLYVISSTGTTGVRAYLSEDLPDFITSIKAIKNVPVAIGFGIGAPEQAQQAWQIAEGVIVGSVLAGKTLAQQKIILSEMKSTIGF